MMKNIIYIILRLCRFCLEFLHVMYKFHFASVFDVINFVHASHYHKSTRFSGLKNEIGRV